MNKNKDGWIRKTYEVVEADFNRGVGDAQTGSTNVSRPPVGVDRRSWMLGYVSALACMDPTGPRDGKETGRAVLVAREDGRHDGNLPGFGGPEGRRGDPSSERQGGQRPAAGLQGEDPGGQNPDALLRVEKNGGRREILPVGRGGPGPVNREGGRG